MKILYHHRTQRIGVEGVHISGLINGLRGLGHEVIEIALVTESAAPGSKVGETGESPAKLLFRWISRHVPNKFFRMLEIGYNPVAFLKMMKAISKHRPDIIYERYAYFNCGSVFAARLMKVPVLLEVNVTTHMADARQLELQRWGRLIEKIVLKKADAITVVSNYLKTHLTSIGINETKIHVQPNACMVEEVDSLEKGRLPKDVAARISDKVVVGFLGRLLPWYKLGSLVTAFHEVHKKHPATFILFIGDGKERQSLEAMIGEYDLADHVYITGEVPHREAMALLGHVDIGVIPSTNMWGSPMKLFEYMGQGVTVLAPDIDVITSIMSDSVNGKTFTYDDFTDFEEALAGLVADDRLRKELGEKARTHIMANHTWKKVAENTIAIADRLVRHGN